MFLLSNAYYFTCFSAPISLTFLIAFVIMFLINFIVGVFLKNTKKMQNNNTKNARVSCKNELDKQKGLSLFCKGDIVVYASLVLCLLFAFLILVFPKANSKYSGFTLLKANETVLTFSFESSTPLKIEDKFALLTEVEQVDNAYKITVFTNQEKSGYNVILIDTKERTAKVIDANCSERKDCFHSPAIKNNGTIYCSPHDLLIKPIAQKNGAPITG